MVGRWKQNDKIDFDTRQICARCGALGDIEPRAWIPPRNNVVTSGALGVVDWVRGKPCEDISERSQVSVDLNGAIPNAGRGET